jgi:hypothetical protein
MKLRHRIRNSPSSRPALRKSSTLEALKPAGSSNDLPNGEEIHSLFRRYFVLPDLRGDLFCPAGLANLNLQKENKVMEERRMLNANHAALRDSFATQQFNFIFVEIELGLTFCQAARTTGRKEVKQRNIKNAKTALATALKTITRGNTSDQEAGILKPHMDRLKAEIADLDGGPSRHGNRQ